MSEDKFLRLDERSLQYFLAVYAEGSLRAASEKLRLTPSAVGRKVLDLEYRVGTPLFERTAKGSRPTAAAHLLARHLRDRNRRDHLLLERIAELQGLERGEVAISTGEGFAYDMMHSVLADFAREHPGIAIRLTVGATNEILDDLARDRADIAMAFNAPRHLALEVAVEAEDRLLAVVHPQHPLAGAGEAWLRDIAQYPVALHSRHSGIRNLVERIEREDGIALQVQFETNSLQLLTMHVEGSIGMTLLPHSAVSRLAASGAVRLVTLLDSAIIAARNQLLLRKGRIHSPATMMLVDRARERMTSFSGFASDRKK